MTEKSAIVVSVVQRGIELLDSKLPKGWECKINLKDFDIRDGKHCVLGQVFAEDVPASKNITFNGYYLGLKLLDIIGHSVDFGFNTGYPRTGEGIYVGSDALQDEWLRRLAKRQAANREQNQPTEENNS